MAIFGRFFGRAISGAAGYAVGGAVETTLQPTVQLLANEAWARAPFKPLDPESVAAIVAEKPELSQWGEYEAGWTGIDPTRFQHLLDETMLSPEVAELFSLWRRSLINDDDFTHGLRKAKIEPRWDGPLRGLKDKLLSLGELANARQQGFITPAAQRSESALQGLTSDRAEIMFDLAGDPLPVEAMQAAANRGLADRQTFDQAIREGRTKTKYTDLAFAMKQPVLHATDYAGLHLRGWITESEMNVGGALSGYSPEQMNLLFLNRGRPAAPGQMATAAARGIDGPAGRPVDEAQFITAIKQSDIRPEYGPMLWKTRFLYPPLFQITRLVQGGVIDAATAADWATKDRYPPEVVDALRGYWESPTASRADSHLAKAQTQLWTTTHRSYLSGESDDQVASAALAEAGVTSPTIPQVIALWGHERDLIRKQLTPAQVKKAYIKAVVNETTGQPWTKDDALAGLLERGYSHTDATTFLDE